MPTFAPPSDGTTKVTAVGASAPITSTGGTTPTIGISPATSAAAGSLSVNDKLKLDSVSFGAQVNSVISVAGKSGAVTLTAADVSGAVSSVSGTAPIVSSGGTTPAISISAATSAAAGSMSAADKEKLDFITVTDDVTLDRLADAIYVTDYMTDMEDDLGAALVQAQLEAYNTATRLRTTSWASPSGIVKSGTTVTVTSSTHLLNTNDIVVLRGANESLYNDERGFEVTRIDANNFSFQVLSGDPDPTGSIEWRSYGGTSIGRLMNRPIVIPPGQYKMRTVAELKSSSAMTVDIWGYGAVIRQAPEFPTGRCMIEMGIPSGAEPFDANDWYTSQPFFATIRGVTFRDFDYAIQMGYASCNVNLGRMALIDCDFFGNIYSTSEAVRAFNRSASLHIVRCQFDHVAVGCEAQSIDRIYIDHPRMQIKEYPAAADRPTLSGKFVLRRGIMRVTNGIFNPPLDTPESPLDKPVGWFLTSEYDDWQPSTEYRRGDLVLADGEEEELPVASAIKSGTTVTITITNGHNVRVHERIMLIGAGVDYDDTWFEVASVTSGTVFTIQVDSGLASPSGTITYRRMQLWVCKTGGGGVTDPGNHTSAADFMTDKATHWILVDQAQEGPLSVWVDLFIDKTLFGGESGGINPVIWNVWEDNGVSRKSGSSTNTVTYHRTVRMHDCLIGTNSQSGTRAFDIGAYSFAAVNSLTSTGTTATLVTNTAHGLRTNDVIEIYNSTPSDYNGQWKVTYVDDTTVTFTLANDPADTTSGAQWRKNNRVSPAVLMVKIPNRIEVTGCKFSATASVAADYWGEQDPPEAWLPTRYRPLECIVRDNHGGTQSNLFVSSARYRDVSVNYVPSDIIAPTYTHTSGFGMYIPTNARVVKTSFGTEQDIYSFFNIANGQEFTVICDTNTDIYNNTGIIKLSSAGTFAPGANGGAISFVVVDGCAYETGRVEY